MCIHRRRIEDGIDLDLVGRASRQHPFDVYSRWLPTPSSEKTAVR
jgi:hypothetical protein